MTRGPVCVPRLANSPWAQQSCCPALGPFAPLQPGPWRRWVPSSIPGRKLALPWSPDSRWRQPVLRAGVKSKLLLPTQTGRGTSRPNEPTAHRSEQCWPHAILLCCVGMQRASSPGVGHCLQCMVGVCVCYRVTHREKSGISALHTRDRGRGRPGNGQGSCNPFFVAQPWEEHTQVAGPTSPSQCLLPTPQSCLRT